MTEDAYNDRDAIALPIDAAPSEVRSMNERPEPIDRDLATELFEQLIKWRDETAPDDNSSSTDQKNYKANQALFFGQRLFDDLLGWAFDHAIGVELTGIDLQQRKEGGADDHRFESAGREWRLDDPTEAREIAASFLLRSGAPPPLLRRPIGEALQSLNLDEVKPLVAPSSTGRWRGAHTLLHIRRLAIMHVHFLWGRGTHKKKQALEEVATALGASVGTLRTWERHWLPKNDSDVKGQFEIANRAGKIQRQIDQDPEFSTPDKVANAVREVLLNDQTLEKVAEEHRQALRTNRTG